MGPPSFMCTSIRSVARQVDLGDLGRQPGMMGLQIGEQGHAAPRLTREPRGVALVETGEDREGELLGRLAVGVDGHALVIDQPDPSSQQPQSPRPALLHDGLDLVRQHPLHRGALDPAAGDEIALHARQIEREESAAAVALERAAQLDGRRMLHG